MENINKFLEILNHNIGNNKNVTYDFFSTFSRFEYSLKHCGYAVNDYYGNAMADWNQFAFEHNKKFDLTLLSENNELKDSIKYLYENPPRILKVYNNKLKWENRQHYKIHNLKNLLNIIKATRNNLFHGSKRIVIFKEPTRDFTLIKSSLIILDECLNYNANLKTKFIEI